MWTKKKFERFSLKRILGKHGREREKVTNRNGARGRTEGMFSTRKF